ncbi:Uncharacterised protein [Legionella busanensis]|uniref:Uncharacterized protein n=1 Tax=Legionella busanensis TaxID=190655 RepID=A0A378JIF6_9GAMM|nr:hypothetical protein [Legionella busanensis]STX50448.1 Uncharacterised protein [Legionella busanensis]
MDTLKPLGLISILTFSLIGATSAATNINVTSETSKVNITSAQKTFNIATDYIGSGRIRSYEYCSRNVFKPCMKSGGSYRYCNKQHHLCTYGHLYNCIKGSKC